MSSAQVDFDLVRYSPVENTHYFYDPAYPHVIQFLLNGQWESRTVEWVKNQTRDPVLQHLAAEAETSRSRPRTFDAQPCPEDSTSRSVAGVARRHVKRPHDSSAGSKSALPSVALSPSAPDLHSSSWYHHSSSPSFPKSAPSIGGNKPSLRSSNTAYKPTEVAPQSLAQTATPPTLFLSRNRETKILLSLDGDGVRGFSQVLLIESLIDAICTKVGIHMDPFRIFDLAGGSSAGGLIAILLTRLRMQAHEARETYKMVAKSIFANKLNFFRAVRPRTRNQSPVDDGRIGLQEEITAIVGHTTGHHEDQLRDMREESANVFAISTRIDIGVNKAAIIRSYQSRRITGPEVEDNISIRDAMCATVMAPRHIPPVEGEAWRPPVLEPGLVDYGTAKNNPVRDLLYECRKLYRYSNDLMVIISIGPGQGHDPQIELPEMMRSVHDRAHEAARSAERFENDFRSLMDLGWMKYFRFNVTDLHDVPLEEWRCEDQLSRKTSAYLEKEGVKQDFYACVNAVAAVLTTGGHAPRT